MDVSSNGGVGWYPIRLFILHGSEMISNVFYNSVE
jgi:hypothetical protein